MNRKRKVRNKTFTSGTFPEQGDINKKNYTCYTMLTMTFKIIEYKDK